MKTFAEVMTAVKGKPHNEVMEAVKAHGREAGAEAAKTVDDPRRAPRNWEAYGHTDRRYIHIPEWQEAFINGWNNGVSRRQRNTTQST